LICIAWLGALKPSHAFGLPSSGPYKVSIDDTPPPIGLGRILIHVEDKTTHQPATNGTVIAKAAMPSMGMGDNYHEASPVTGRPGEYELDWPFQMAGEWEIHA